MACELSDNLRKQVKDDKEYSESELLEAESSESSSETEYTENVEEMDDLGRQRAIDDDEGIR